MAFFYLLGWVKEKKIMEIFKTDSLKKEFKDLVKNISPKIAECGNCKKFCSRHCKKFCIICSLCREERCKNCCNFEASKEVLLTNGTDILKKYVADFISDHLNISDVRASFFNIDTEKAVKKRDNFFVVKSYQKSKKIEIRFIIKSYMIVEKYNIVLRVDTAIFC